MPRPVEVQEESRDFTPGRFLAFRRRRTALRCRTAIRHHTCGAPHALLRVGLNFGAIMGAILV
jgi:hypothetical protein